MPRIRIAMAAAAAATLLWAGGAVHAAVAPARAPDPFDARIAASKAAMMADPQTALQHAREALAAARTGASAGREARVATAQWLEGEALLRLNRLDEAAPVVAQGLAAVQRVAPDSKLHGDLMMAQAGILATKGSVQPALADLQGAYRIFGKAGEPRSQAMALQDIGSIYQDARDYPKVLEYYAQSADLYPGDPVLVVTADNNIGNAYKALKKYPEAVADLEKALQVARRMQSPLLEAHVLTNLASTEVEWGRLDAAQRHVSEALRITRTEPEAGECETDAFGVAAQLALARGDARGAARWLDRVFSGLDLKATPLPFRDFHETAYKTYLALHDDRRALAHLQAFMRLDDEARDLAASTNAALMTAQFDFANQASRIARLKAIDLQREVQLTRSRNLVTGVLLAASVIIAVLLMVAFLWIRRSRNAVRAANGMLSQVNESLEQALEARTQFLATTSHEIRTPLNGILGMTQVLLNDRRLDADLKDKIALVHGSGETMKALVDDILDLAKIEGGRLEIHPVAFDLHRLCDETVRLWAEKAEGKGLSLVLEVADAPQRIVEDQGRLRQILFNLMSNAVKFTEAGAVTLRAEVYGDGGGERLLLSVVDTGIGIPEDRQDELFEAFRQLDGSTSRTYGGTGLGLAICRKLARAMGGDVMCESAPGRGSAFTLDLPLEVADAERAQDGEVEAPADLQACRVLVCDPNPLSRSVVRAVLQPVARLVETAGDLEAVTEPDAAPRFDLLLVDGAALPDGAEACSALVRTVASATAPGAVVILAANLDEPRREALLSAGAAQVIGKPVPAPALLAALQAGLAARAQAPEGLAVSAARSKLA